MRLLCVFGLMVLMLFLAGCGVESYMCQVEDCRGVLVGMIDSASESVYFMAYSLTDDGVGDALVRAGKRGVDVKGVMEKQQRSAYSEFDKLKQNGVDVRWDDNSALMHHKVFVVDGKVVVTGSCNPTENGFKNNDENLVVIRNGGVVEDFMREFERVFG
ncbi:MAG: hypothetical protein KKG60_01390 [Nanoarchaeota archaeon]|nr:hypothetical protein [Nanoarchaeota archaeon]